jgi:GNAT superfamily N-acetyltransferase
MMKKILSGNIYHRIQIFYGKYGIGGTIKRILAIPLRTIKDIGIVFYVDLSVKDDSNCITLNGIEKKKKEGDLKPEDVERLIELRGEKIVKETIRKRFSEGMVLWLLKRDDVIVTVCWTIEGVSHPRLPIPLGERDVFFFDVETFPEFKGQGWAPVLINNIIEICKKHGLSRAYINIKKWNRSSLSFVRKTFFKRLGAARVLYVFGKKIAIWG